MSRTAALALSRHPQTSAPRSRHPLPTCSKRGLAAGQRAASSCSRHWPRAPRSACCALRREHPRIGTGNPDRPGKSKTRNRAPRAGRWMGPSRGALYAGPSRALRATASESSPQVAKGPSSCQGSPSRIWRLPVTCLPQPGRGSHSTDGSACLCWAHVWPRENIARLEQRTTRQLWTRRQGTRIG